MSINSESTSSHCLEFTSAVHGVILIIKVVLWLLGVALTFLLVVCDKRVRRHFISQPLLECLIVASIIQGFCQILEQLSVKVSKVDPQQILAPKNGWRAACQLFAYLDVVSTWITNFLMIWITIRLLLIMRMIVKLPSRKHTSCVHNGHINKRKSHIGKIIGIIILFVSGAISLIPFAKLKGTNMYGISGPWCWIRTIGDDDCLDADLQKFSSFLIISVVSPQLVIFVVGLLCFSKMMLGVQRLDQIQGIDKKSIRNFILMYNIIYPLLYLLPWANRMYVFYYTNQKNHHPNYYLWIMHAFADSSRVLVLGIYAMICQKNSLLLPPSFNNILSRQSGTNTSISNPNRESMSDGLRVS